MYSIFHAFMGVLIALGIALMIYGRLKGRFIKKHLSTYGGFVIFACAAFGVTPTVGSFVAVFGLLPIAIVVTIWLAKHEVAVKHEAATTKPEALKGV